MIRTLLIALLLVSAAPRAAAADDVVVDEAAEQAFFRGVALLQAEAYAEALIDFEEALRLQPDLRRVHFYKATAHLRVGDYALARQAAEKYAAFDLDEGEARQLEELRAELEALDPGGSDAAPDEDDEEDGGDRVAPRMDAEEAMLRSEQALRGGDCVEAIEMADAALRLDPRTWRAFLLKGQGLLCTGEPERARSIVLALQELHGGTDARTDAEAAELMAQIDAALAATEAASRAPVGGDDPRVTVAFGRAFVPGRGELDRKSRRERVVGVGATRTSRLRFPLAGSRADGRAWWIADQGRLSWVRIRVWGRRGTESPSWFADAFAEMFVEVRDRFGGPPAEVAGIDRSGANGSAGKALAGLAPYSAAWADGDGDRVSVRLGRCTLPGKRGESLVANAPCLEFIAHVGAWEAKLTDPEELAAARRTEAPGLRTLDFSVSFLGALPAPTMWHERGMGGTLGYAPAPGLQLGGGVLARFGFEGLAWGVGWEGSASAAVIFNQTPVFFENRVMFYVGGRFAPRQPSSFDVLFGVGFSPEAGGVFPSLGLRFISSARTDRRGRFVFSIEPHVIISDTYLTIVPFRISLGGAVGTTPEAIAP